MRTILQAINSAICREAFPPDFDVQKYKSDFATLMSVLEDAAANKDEMEDAAPEDIDRKKGTCLHSSEHDTSNAKTESPSSRKDNAGRIVSVIGLLITALGTVAITALLRRER